MIQRTIDRVIAGDFHRGFLGEGHLAKAVVDGNDFTRTDPFIMLMDDRLNLPGGDPVGGAHPHAGFETVTLVLQGDGKEWQTGSLELMTAGKGIIHTEEIASKTELHILQLWLALPPGKRWTTPFWQQMLLENVPRFKDSQSEIRVYSGSSNGLTAPLQNHTPFTLVDVRMKANGMATQSLPAGYNGFIYVLDGTVGVGATEVRAGQSGWLDDASGDGESEIRFNAGDADTHFVLYAAAPHGVPVVSHGPFIGDSREDIARLYREYHAGSMPHLNSLPASSRIRHGR